MDTSVATIAPPTPGIDKVGFIDQSDGANIRTGPAESGGTPLLPTPLPPATRVYVSGTHPSAPGWWYVTAYLKEDKTVVRGYVQGFRVNVQLPEPLAELYQVGGQDTAEQLARWKFGSAVSDGHDLRYYENVLLYVNRAHHRDGVAGTFQSPGVLGGGSNNVQLLKGKLIWLVSAPYAKALEQDVPSGSLTGGAVAKAKRVAAHVTDILRSVAESRNHFSAVAGEYAQAIRDHIVEISGIVAAFITAEAASAFLAAAPTGVSQIAAVVIQLALSAFGAAGLVQAGIEAIKHATEWITLAWTAHGDAQKITASSIEFLRLLVSVAIAALSYLGAKANYGNALRIAGSTPTGALPALAVAGGEMANAGAGAAVAIGPGTGALGVAGNAMMQSSKDGEGKSEQPASKEAVPTSGDQKVANLVKETIARAKAGKLLKASKYHPHFDDSTVLEIIKDSDAVYQSQGKSGRLIFRKGTDIVVVEGPGSSGGRVVTGYGPKGVKGQSGAAALGGSAGDAGAPVTESMVIDGTIPVPKGRPPLPKATKIR